MADTSLTRTIILDGNGGANIRNDFVAEGGKPGAAQIWYRLDQDTPGLGKRLTDDLQLDPFTAHELLAKETRPTCITHGDGAIIILRGVNLNPDARPEDMISIRLWAEKDRLISIQMRPLSAVEDIQAQLETATGQKTLGDILVAITEGLTSRMQPVIEQFEAELEELEDARHSWKVQQLRDGVTDLRRKIVTLRRFIEPQRDALEKLVIEPFSWQTKMQDRRTKSIADRISRIVEHLDAIHARAAIFQDSLAVLVAERLNRTMFILAIVAGVFLPLTLITGLLGINVSGIPFATSPFAFPGVTLLLVVVAIFEIYIFMRMKFFDALK